ncbi:SHOCT domain-containing protein [Aldersonia sp. NBC_00410]|uniref:SHOCT domain-containing protein n=1 Tax=Aldersonia sp. NBC_00410 TaxID=2975954 RepID=UPI00224F64E6|nr:SHOCT domain-containing protein [Aldersonia sp. NBC_00410]MCX5044061.1 SHOCT domain-containing protein [Aldersonia sp. NBC_00410]
MMWWNNGMGWGSWALMVLAMIVFWTLVVVGILALFRTLRTSGDQRFDSGARDARQILDERFARGEIDAEEYRTRSDQLRTRR